MPPAPKKQLRHEFSQPLSSTNGLRSVTAEDDSDAMCFPVVGEPDAEIAVEGDPAVTTLPGTHLSFAKTPSVAK